MTGAAQILDRLAGDGRIAVDWVAGLGAADPGIDTKLEACLANVAGAGPYLPVEQDENSVIWRAFELPLNQVGSWSSDRIPTRTRHARRA